MDGNAGQIEIEIVADNAATQMIAVLEENIRYETLSRSQRESPTCAVGLENSDFLWAYGRIVEDAFLAQLSALTPLIRAEPQCLGVISR
jgi:hypothetical protein